jgi:hypothetical protein
MSLKLKVRPNILPSPQNLKEKESIIVDELTSFTYNNRKEICVVLKSFLSFFKIFEKNKTHNMFSLMLDIRFKSLCLMSSFIEENKVLLLLKNMIRNPCC